MKNLSELQENDINAMLVATGAITLCKHMLDLDETVLEMLLADPDNTFLQPDKTGDPEVTKKIVAQLKILIFTIKAMRPYSFTMEELKESNNKIIADRIGSNKKLGISYEKLQGKIQSFVKDVISLKPE